MVQITLPDTVRTYGQPVRGADIAAGSVNAMTAKALAMRVNGVSSALDSLIDDNADVEIVRREQPEALDLIRHDPVHVIAGADCG